METKLYKNEIKSFVGDVLPLYLLGDGDLRHADIRWRVRGEGVSIRGFEDEVGGFSCGVLLTLLSPGECEVVCEYGGREYTCRVSVRETRDYTGEQLNFYTADLHCHTTMIHDRARLSERVSDYQSDYVRFIKEANDIDLSVISDHSDVIDAWEFFRSFVDVLEAAPMSAVILPGSESEVSFIERDRFGLEHKNSGEIVILGSDNFASVATYEELYSRMATSPFAIGILAHPQIVGWGPHGIWNWSLDSHRDDGLSGLVKLVEVGNGCAEVESNHINEYIYSVALDNGFCVSTACSSDKHEAPWGAEGFPGKTVVMAAEPTKEAFLDALRSGRCYASDSGNIKLSYSVNGKAAPARLELSSVYSFHVEVGYFCEDESTRPVRLSVISDYGKTVAEFYSEELSSFDFTLESDTARYFYLRLEDREHRKTLSPAVFCGREIDASPTVTPVPISKSGFRATELISGKDASAVISDSPSEPYIADGKTAEILIDMGECRRASALGHYPMRVVRGACADVRDAIASLVGEYAVSVSTDGKSFCEVASGLIRVYGGEVIIRFAPVEARFVRFSAKSTVGALSHSERFADARVAIGELTVFE